MKILDKLLLRTNLSGNRRKVVKNVYWAVVGKLVNIASGLLVGVLVARNLGPENFGLMNYVISYVTLFSVLAAFGLDNIEVRELSRTGADRNTLMGTAFVLRIGFALVALLLILGTLLSFESDHFTFVMVMVYSLSLVFSSLNVIRNYFTSIILNEYVVKTEISRTVLGALIKIVLLINNCSVGWFIVASMFDFFLVGAGYLFSYRRKVGTILEWNVDWGVAKMLIRASFPLLLSGAAVIIYQRINAVMIRNMIDNASVGQFSAAAKISEIAIFIPMVIAQSITPLLVKAHEADPQKYLEKKQYFVDIMVWSSIAISVAMALLAAPGIRILFGEKYLEAIPVLQIMSWKALATALFGASGQLIVIENLHKYVVLRNLAGCVFSVVLNYYLIPVWGIAGSAIATIVAMIFAGYFSHLIIRPYRYLFTVQTKALALGWRQLVGLKHLWR
ncbi:hypothetical protein PDESU_00700 [Pontiella desulfatans]|uniref:Uncharacterized protein n=1 Tax=Pontiella desulfatans TaxID=2750659 RepID=A0A6C2TX30_PONDE|nr:flippase [Pontiella desulfatans]VGO12149.1 hypothetical protein PDESU_00700 [Pontiella desulfatans]